MSALVLRVEVSAGQDISDAVREACALVESLNLNRIYFTANGEDYICYRSRVMRRSPSSSYQAAVNLSDPPGTLLQWTKIEPIRRTTYEES